MAGLVAVTTGAPTALTFSRIDLAMRVAEAERARLDRLAAGTGIDPHLFRHLAACATLQGGCDAEAARRLVEEERAALGDRSAARTGDIVEHLATALPLPGSGDIDAVRPDLIGEALLCQHLTGNRRKLEEQCAIVGRAFVRAGTPVVRAVIRAAQDLAQGDAAHPSVAWLDHVAGQTMDTGVLAVIADELPHSTLALRERAMETTKRLVDAHRARPAAEPDRLPNLATWLNTLSVRLGDLGRREEALSAIQEAVDIRRALTAAHPDTFRPDLAQSLWVMADRLDEAGDLPGSVAANTEAIAALTAPFQRLPAAHTSKMDQMVARYRERCNRLEQEPDMALLTPVLSLLGSMQQDRENSP